VCARSRPPALHRRWKYTVTEHINGKNCSATLTFLKMDGWQSTRIMENSCIHSPETAKVHVCPIPPPPPPPLVLVGISPAFDAISCGARWMVAKNAYFYISYPFGGWRAGWACTGRALKASAAGTRCTPSTNRVNKCTFLARCSSICYPLNFPFLSPSAADSRSCSRVSELCPDLWAARLISFLECIAAE
jgi:hypothetical protein